MIRENYFKGKMHFLFITYMATPKHENPCPGCHKIYKSGRPYCVYHNCIDSLLDLSKGFKEIHQFYTCNPQIMSHWSEGS